MSFAPRPLPDPVVTVLEPEERVRVDAAGAGLYRAIHRETIADALDELKRRPVSAILLSVVRCGREQHRRMVNVVREFPSVPTLALLGAAPTSADSLLQLGNAGITQLVDVRGPAGWNRLRELLSHEHARVVDRRALCAIRAEFSDEPPECWPFFEAIFSETEHATTVRELARRMGILSSTLMSRFFRAALPSPKRYLAYARLLRASRLFRDRGHAIADVANALEYSSPQSFGRHVRTLLGVTAGEFRSRYDEQRMLDRILDELVRPHRAKLEALRPVTLRRARRVRGDDVADRDGPRSLPPSLSSSTPAFMRRVP